MPKRIIIMIAVIAAAIVLTVIISTLALAQDPAAKYVSRETIESAEGHPKILMDCVDGRRWARHIPVRVVAIYTDGEGQREEEIDMMPGVEDTHITLHVPPEVASDPALQGLRLLYELSHERCESGYGPGMWTQ